MMRKKTINKKGIVLVFAIYMVVLFVVLVLKFPTGMLEGAFKKIIAGEPLTRLEPQWIPFKTTIHYVSQARSINDWFVKNLVCNVVMFMPFGFLIPWFSKWKGWKIIGAGCVLSITIEVLQYVSALGQMDVDDVILNTLGAALGYGVFCLQNGFGIDCMT